MRVELVCELLVACCVWASGVDAVDDVEDDSVDEIVLEVKGGFADDGDGKVEVEVRGRVEEETSEDGVEDDGERVGIVVVVEEVGTKAELGCVELLLGIAEVLDDEEAGGLGVVSMAVVVDETSR